MKGRSPLEAPPVIGWALRILREDAGLTIKQVADAALVSATHLRRVEDGHAGASPKWCGLIASTITALSTKNAAEKTEEAHQA